MEILGYFAAVGTSLLFSFGSISFTKAGRMVGSPVVNRVRLLVAWVAVAALHLLIYGTVFPFDAGAERLGVLGVSGFIGFVLGDAFLFQAFVLIGPRLATLMMALAPVLTTLLAWLALEEQLLPRELIGIAVTIAGIAYVVTDRRAGGESMQAAPGTRAYWVGILCGLGGAIGQALGLILSKQGLSGDFPALSGNLIRLTSATVCIWALALVMGQARPTLQRMTSTPDALKFILAGSLLGPVLAVTLGLYSVQHIPAGISSTLQSLMPIFLIPISYLFFREVPSQRGVVGTVVALAGTAMLFL
jgi:drug/metabolite transporter (DMT)-like permease